MHGWRSSKAGAPPQLTDFRMTSESSFLSNATQILALLAQDSSASFNTSFGAATSKPATCNTWVAAPTDFALVLDGAEGSCTVTVPDQHQGSGYRVVGSLGPAP